MSINPVNRTISPKLSEIPPRALGDISTFLNGREVIHLRQTSKTISTNVTEGRIASRLTQLETLITTICSRLDPDTQAQQNLLQMFHVPSQNISTLLTLEKFLSSATSHLVKVLTSLSEKELTDLKNASTSRFDRVVYEAAMISKEILRIRIPNIQHKEQLKSETLRLAMNLAKVGAYDTAVELSKEHLQNQGHLEAHMNTIAQICMITSERGEFDKTFELLNTHLQKYHNRYIQYAQTLEKICSDLLEDGTFNEEAIATAKEIPDKLTRENVFLKIAEKLKATGQFDRAEEVIQNEIMKTFSAKSTCTVL